MLALLHSDRAVMRKALGGNEGAFRVLVDRYAGVVHGVAFARLKNAADAEDVAQETFIRFYQHLDQMAHRRHIGPWLVRVARNASSDLLRKRLRDSGRPLSAEVEKAHVPDPVREEMHRILWEQIEHLDADAREVLVLRYFMKKKAREIAALLEITPDAAAKRLQRARDELGRRLTDVLGDEIDEARADARRSNRIMVAVLATPAAWKASASGAAAAVTAAGVATGAGAAKLAATVAVIASLAILGYLGYELYSRPYEAQDITAASTFEVVENEAAPEAIKTAPANQAQTSDAAESAEAAAASMDGESAVPAVYAVIRGTVIFEDGQPAVGARVTLDNQEDLDQYERSTAAGVEDLEPVEPISYSAMTDAAGKYEIRDVYIATGNEKMPRYRLFGEKGGLYGEVPDLRLTHLQREMTCDFKLLPSGSLGGVVTDLQGKPIKSAFVATGEQQTPAGDRRSRYLWTGDDGLFLMEHLLPGSCRLYVSGPGHLPVTTGFLAVGTTNNVVRLDPGNFISGRVVNRDTGEPVPNINISGHTQGRDQVWLNGKTDSAGNFTVTGCLPGVYALGISPKRKTVLPVTLIEPSTVTIGNEPIRGLELKAAEGATVRGHVYDDETGGLVKGEASVIASGSNRAGSRFQKVLEDGTYELIGLPWEKLDISVICQNRPRYQGTLTINPDDSPLTHDIHLPRRRSFGGTVVDEAGNPVAGASVFAVCPGERFEVGDAVSDTAGCFKLFVTRKEVPSTLYFQAMHETAYSPPAGPYAFKSDAQDIVLRLSTAGRLEGEVVDRAGAPIGDAVVCAIPAETDKVFLYRSSGHIALEVNQGRSVNAMVKPDGSFSYSKLLPGRYTLHVYPFSSLPGSPVATAETTVQTGMTVRARLVVDMSGFGGVEGTVTLDGKPFAGQNIVVQPVSQKWVCPYYIQTDEGGQYAVRNILPGEVEVTLGTSYGSEKGLKQKQVAQINSGEVTRIVFDIAAGHAAAEGYVLCQGQPAVNVEVVFEPIASPGAGGPSARTDAQGYYKRVDLPEGAYRVVATLTDYTTWPETKISQAIDAEVTPDQTARIDFELVGGQLAGTIAGLKPGERALVGVFPPDTVLTEWSVEALEALGEKMVRSTTVDRDGPFSINGMQEGDYLVGAVTLPAEGNLDTQAMLEGRLAVSPVVRVVPGSTAEVDLVFENR
ncbi:MAG TPA: sigma-70 family RNA polymerase sigma factor [Candidatus Bathyarchaeia archaeon]|nr:sigma-70 family RNA polymerase sigma factor [Candidatus Bathyarchaeia archaeon]